MSLYRRVYIFEQFEKVPEPPLDKFDAWRKFPSVLEFARAGDPLGLEAHWDDWTNAGRRCHDRGGAPVLFIDARLLQKDRGDPAKAVADYFRHGALPAVNMTGYDNVFAFETAPRYKAYVRDSEKLLNVSQADMMESVSLLEKTYGPLRHKMQAVSGLMQINCQEG